MYSRPAVPVLRMVPTLSHYGALRGPMGTATAGSQTWGTANMLRYFPVCLPGPAVARRVWWANGTSVSASYNISCAIYTNSPSGGPAAKLVECASTAQGSASTLQFVDVTDTALAPGTYWLALAASDGGASFAGYSGLSAGFAAMSGFEESAVTIGSLPATATPVASTNSSIYTFGFATTASP